MKQASKFFGLAFFGLAAVSANAAYDWNSVQIWGGGYVPGVTFSANGNAYLRTDVGGAYKLNSDNSWTPLNDAFTSPDDMGSVAIAVDSENENYVYSTAGLYLTVDQYASSHGSFLRSSDGGVTWEKIPLKASNVSGTNASKVSANDDKTLALAGNGEGRGMGNRLAVKGSTIYLGTNQNGLLKSTDRGSTWTTISSFSNTSGISAVFFDANGNVYAAPYAGGLYKSTDGNTFSQVSGISGTVYQAAISGSIAWITINTSNTLDQGTASNGSVYKYDVSKGSVTKVTMPVSCGFVGISTTNSGANAVVSTSGCWDGNGGLFDANFKPHGYIYYTQDGGKSWNEILKSGTFDKTTAPGSANNNPHWISALGLNPKNKDHIIFGTGYGIWSTKNATATSPTWTFNDKGIEETVPLSIVSSSYGAPLVSALGDIDGSYHADLNSPMNARHTPNVGTTYVVDYAGQAPAKMIRIHKQAASGLGSYSTNGGKTWTNFTSHPDYVEANSSYNGEANFAAISAKGTSIVWNMYQKGVYYSKDNGSTWTAAKNISDVSGFHVVADKVTDGTFYLYSPSAGKLYKSTDHGANWTVVNSGMATLESYAYGYGKAFASTTTPGEVWVTQGTNSYGIWTNTTAAGVYRSTDGGTSFTKVNGLAFATSIGFGLGKNGGTAVYAVGIVSGGSTIGIYRSDDNGSTWTAVNGNKGFGGVTMITGDPCVYSRVYVGTNGRGILYGEESGSKNTACKDRVDYANSSSSSSSVAKSSSSMAKSSSSVQSSSSEKSSSSSVTTSSSSNEIASSNSTVESSSDIAPISSSNAVETSSSAAMGTSSSSAISGASSNSTAGSSSSESISSNSVAGNSSSSNAAGTSSTTCSTIEDSQICKKEEKGHLTSVPFSKRPSNALKLYRDGDMLVGEGSIVLFDATGHVVRKAMGATLARLSLQGLQQGVYIARDRAGILKISVK